MKLAKRFFHWLGHVVFHADYACHVACDGYSTRLTCKKCGRDVT